MSIMCWNCRGMANPRSVRQLQRWSSSHGPDLLFLCETMINKGEVEKLKSRLGFENAFGVASRGNSGGLCLYWKENLKFSLTSYSRNHISGDIENGDKSWRFVGVYGSVVLLMTAPFVTSVTRAHGIHGNVDLLPQLVLESVLTAFFAPLHGSLFFLTCMFNIFFATNLITVPS